MKTTTTAALAATVALSVSPLQAQETPPAQEPTTPSFQISPDEVVLTVDGTEITQGDVHERFMSRYARQFEQIPPAQQAEAAQQIQRMIVTELVQKALLLNEANRKKLKADEKKVAEAVEELKQSLPPGKGIEDFTAATGLTLDSFKAMVQEDLVIDQLLTNLTNVLPQPTADETKTYYDENADKFKREESVAARHILISTQDISDKEQLAAKEAEAEKIRAELIEKKGENFAEVAKAKSEGPSGKNGGDLGEFGRGQMVPAFDKAAFSQEVGEIGELVKTEFGYHIIQVQKKTEAGKAAYDDVKEKIAEDLMYERRSKAVGTYLQDLEAKAKITEPGQASSEGSKEAPAAPAPPAAPATPASE